MGTGGFLVSYLKNILKKATDRNVQIDWNFIKTQGIYGKEIEPDTYQLAMSNMLISSGHIFEHLERGDSIREPIMRKFDNILANPPFGIKGLKYDDFRLNEDIRNSYIPIKTDNAVSLFIQAIICMLNVNGKCAIVLPDGQDLFSKSNKTLIDVREYLMKTCDLKEIIYLPSGIFTYTSIKTCVFYFVKKVEGSEVMEIKFKKNKKTNVETRTDYKFSSDHKTISVKFYDYNPYENVKNLLVDVPIEKILNNSYSLNYAEYLESDTNNENDDGEEPENGIITKTLGEVCEINQGNNLTKSEMMNGIYSVIGGGKVIGNHNQKNRDGNDFTLTRVGDININYMTNPYYLTDNGFSIKSNQNEVITKYVYYLLLHNKNYLINLYQGLGQKVISKTNLKLIKIQIPSLVVQNDIVQYLDFIYEKSNKTSTEKINELKQLNEFCLNNQMKFGNNINKTLGEICEFNIGGTPLRNKNEYYDNGTNLWLSVRELNGGYIYDTKEKITDLGVENSSVKLFKKDTILFSFKLSIGKTAIVGNPLYTNEAIAGILSKDDDLLNSKYLYYYLSINDFSKMSSGLLGAGSLNKKSLAENKIKIPSLDKQKEIVEYCDRNCKLIEQLENEIKNNKKMAKEFLDNILGLSSEMNATSVEIIDVDLKTHGLEDEDMCEEELCFYKGSIKEEQEEEEIFLKK
jgi:restriction endonuclease S subunit